VKAKDPFNQLLVRIYCAAHGNVAGEVVESRDGPELQSTTKRGPAADRPEMRLYGAVSRSLADSHLTAVGCQACGDLPIDADGVRDWIASARRVHDPIEVVVAADGSFCPGRRARNRGSATAHRPNRVL
jgi:hypothetical protein